MAQDEWRRVEGDLRASLAARDWSKAGASVWQLRQIDESRYFEELDHYVTQQCRAGGYTMALETEQRLEAIRQWLRMLLQEDLEQLRYHQENDIWGQVRNVRPSFEILARGGHIEQAFRGGQGMYEVSAKARQLIPLFQFDLVRADIQDVIWSVLQEFDEQPR